MDTYTEFIYDIDDMSQIADCGYWGSCEQASREASKLQVVNKTHAALIHLRGSCTHWAFVRWPTNRTDC